MFIEEGGGIVFYKNKSGDAVRELAPGALGQLQPMTVMQTTSTDGKGAISEGPGKASRAHGDVIMVEN